MRSVCGLLLLLIGQWAWGDNIALVPENPVLARVQGGELQRYRLPVPSGQRGFVTLVPLDGDADVFILLPPEMSLAKTPLKSVSAALQPERVVVPAQKQAADAVVVVKGITPTRFLLTVSWTKRQGRQVPDRSRVVAIHWQEVQATDSVALGAVTVQNRTPGWYEIRLHPKGMSKAVLPNVFLLGPNGSRYLGWVALAPGAHLQVAAERTPKADIALVADLVSRAVAGTALAPDLQVAMDDLLPHLTPLLPVATAVRQGDWRRAAQELVTTLRQRPQTLRALQTFLARAGLTLPATGLQKPVRFGALSAVVTAIAAAKLPARETVTLVWL